MSLTQRKVVARCFNYKYYTVCLKTPCSGALDEESDYDILRHGIGTSIRSSFPVAFCIEADVANAGLRGEAFTP